MKKFFLILLGLIILIVVGVTVFLLTFDLNSYRNIITEKVSDAIGRSVKIESLNMKLSLIPTIKVRNVTVENPERFGSAAPLLHVDSLDATLAIVPLFSRRIEVQSIAFGDVSVNLIDKGGVNNWTIKSSHKQSKGLPSEVKNPGNDATSQVRVDTVSAKNLKLTYQNPQKEQSIQLTNITVNQLKVFSMNALFNDVPFKISGTVNSLLDLITQKPDYLFNLEASGADMDIKLSGSIGNTQLFKDLLLNVEASGKSLKQSLSAFAVDNTFAPAQPFTVSAVLQGDLKEIQLEKFLATLGGKKMQVDLKGNMKLSPKFNSAIAGTIQLSDRSLGQFWGVQPFTADLDLIFSPPEIQLKRLNLMANRSDISISGQVKLTSPKMNVGLTIASEYLDIQDLLQSTERGYVYVSSYRAQGGVIPDKPIDLSFLKRLDADVKFSLPHMSLTDALHDYVGVDGALSVKDGTLLVSPLNITLLQGSASGTIRAVAGAINNISVRLTGGNFQLDGIKSVENIVKDASLDMTLNLTASGNSVKSILSTLTGRIIAEIPQGTIVSHWFNGLPGELGIAKKNTVSTSTTDSESKIVCGAINLDLKNGQIQGNNNIAIETSLVNFIIGENINLPQETLSLSMVPFINIPKKTVKTMLQTVGRFIKITGTFSHLDWPTIDTDRAVQGLLQLAQKKEPYQLCQSVLDRQPKGQALIQSKKQQMLPEPKPVTSEQSQKKKPATFREQLMDTVSKALK